MNRMARELGWVMVFAIATGCEGPVSVPAAGETDEDGTDDDDATTTGDVPSPVGEESGESGATTFDPPAPNVCGDGVRGGDEECDGTDLGGATCMDFGAFEGELACKADCVFEDCDCDWGDGPSCDPPVCGNGIAEAGEACDGSDIPGWEFAPTCTDVLGGDYYGPLQCIAWEIDTSLCGTCGDGVVQDEYEDCDGAAVDEDGNQLQCAPDEYGEVVCSDECWLDYDGCQPLCGNGVIDAGESCDGDELAGATCPSLGFAGGELSCSGSCTFSTYQCNACGNGVLDDDEECDGLDFGGADCSAFAVDGEGEPVCTATCELEPLSCVPGNGSAFISEILVASFAQPLENVGEWIELHNPSSETFDLQGCELRGQAAFETFTIGAVEIPPGGYVTFGKGTEEDLGFVPSAALAEQVTFLNGGDVVRLACVGVVIDEVEYDETAPWPEFEAGVAIAVAGSLQTDADNDDGSAWCSAPTEYAIGQRGTPGATNDCP
jgi:hypothetical protein